MSHAATFCDLHAHDDGLVVELLQHGELDGEHAARQRLLLTNDILIAHAALGGDHAPASSSASRPPYEW